MALSYEQVARTADQMVARGEDPVVRKIREVLGEGSLGTIHKHLSAWRKEKKFPSTGSPAGLSEELTRTMLQEVRNAIASSTAPLAGELDKLKGENADLARECETRDQEIDTLRRTLAETTEELQRSQGENRLLLSEIERERASSEEARMERARADLRLEDLPRLREEIASLRQSVETERAGKVEAEKRSAVAQALLEQLQPKRKEH